MRVKTVKIEADVEAVLRAGAWRGWLFVLPEGELERPLYLRVANVLKLLGGQWNRSHGGFMFGVDAKRDLDAALNEGGVVDRKKTWEQFFTPADVAGKLIGMLDICNGHTVLEPSAGNGRLIWEALERGASVHAVEIDPDLCEDLRREVRERQKLGVLTVSNDDFLEWGGTGRLFDRVIMNPPFGHGADMTHVIKAFGMLKRGGQLAAVMSPSWGFVESVKARGFREWLKSEPELYRWSSLGRSAFRESGTEVETGIMLMSKRA